ncbi:hypothetical protein [Actinomadura sp. SCN-SB]|uniref:hypothetical protein n=1 Tax=Actinomadura sp. SCN-SB TaxID=3373092 RepID=UPI0037532024
MTSVQDPRLCIDDMARKRGYVLGYHKVMAKHACEVLQAADVLVSAACLDERMLDRRSPSSPTSYSVIGDQAGAGAVAGRPEPEPSAAPGRPGGGREDAQAFGSQRRAG